MKWLFRLATIGMLVGALAVPFFISNKQGQPMLTLPKASDFVPSAIAPAVNSALTSEATPSLAPGQTTVYKWRDQNGVWHYGDAAPTGTQNVTTLQVDSNTNVIQGLKKEPEADPEPTAPIVAPQKAETNAVSEVLSLDRAMNILNETRDVKASMEARNAQLKQLAGD